MSNKKIEIWKNQAANGKTIFVATKVKTIHPVVDAIVKNLCEIVIIQYVRITQEDIQASNEIKIKGRIKMPVSTPDHPSAIGIHLILDFTPNTIQFHEITSASDPQRCVRMLAIVPDCAPRDAGSARLSSTGPGGWQRLIHSHIQNTRSQGLIRPGFPGDRFV